ncbi:hypothetical protein DE146DRAFT_634917 [Phaeosphaeria sp. MPI-PUGE-AT-0046c]|nr:hypothetical protein DE146DRAFT_634917 [Phaeosphaeria sp. MPI-PUGE-AT-0046c]
MFPDMLDRFDARGMFPLHGATMKGYRKAVGVVLDKGVSIDAECAEPSKAVCATIGQDSRWNEFWSDNPLGDRYFGGNRTWGQDGGHESNNDIWPHRLPPDETIFSGNQSIGGAFASFDMEQMMHGLGSPLKTK